MWKPIHFRKFRELHNYCKSVGIRNFLLSERVEGTSSRKELNTDLSTSSIGSVNVHQDHVTVNHGHCSSDSLRHHCLNPSSTNISLLWLRDHCRCSHCYNHMTNQRIHSVCNITHQAYAKKCILEENHLKITWIDDHISTYPLDWLLQLCRVKNPPNSTVLWNKNIMESLDIKNINMTSFMRTDEGLKELLMSIIKYGIGFVKNVTPTKIATQQVAERISHIQTTFFGSMWEFSDSYDHQDTAYSRDALGAHTDNTYLSEAGGLQVFHCLHHDGIGGETLLVDGFNAANSLKQKHPRSFKRLTETVIDSEYKESGKYYLASGPVLRLCPKLGQVKQIRFNMYDRAPLNASSLEEVHQFYEDICCLSSIISDTTSEWWFKLQPGTILFINNWRILHGRASYTGHRRIAGCYIGHSDWCSKARVLGLLK